MDSAATIGSVRARASTYRLGRWSALSRLVGTPRTWSRWTGLASLRRLGIRALLLADVMLGLWLAGTYIYVFHALSRGGIVGEPDIFIARTELWLSIGVTCWFLWQVPYWALKLLRGSPTTDPTEPGKAVNKEEGKH